MAVLPRRSHGHRAPRAAPAGRPENRLLAGLTADAFQRLRPHLTVVSIRRRQLLGRRDEPIREVFFPNGGVCSVVGVLSTGAMVECATVGDEGMLGIEAFLDHRPVRLGDAIVQVPDTDATVLSVREFRREIDRHGAFHEAVARYTESVIAQIMQQAVCNALHDVPQRCARWLLATEDRMHRPEFALSHEFLALMLGVQRPTVSVVAATLQQAGLIRYSYGRVAVTDRAGLEAASCECYGVMKKQIERLRP